MATQDINYFIVKNKDIEDLKDKLKLPLNDTAVFINGRLEESQLTEDDLIYLNNVIKYQSSVYPKNGIVLESGHTKIINTNRYEEVEHIFQEHGYYYLQISSAGGRDQDLNRFVGTWCILNRNKKIIDKIIIYQQNEPKKDKYRSDPKEEYSYTWERVSYYDKNDPTNDNEELINDYWKGTYTYLNDTVFLSLKSLNGVERNDDDYGVLMLKQDIFENDQVFKLYSWRNDDTIDDIEYKYDLLNITTTSLDATNISRLPISSDYNTTDSKGSDGQYFGDVFLVVRNKDNSKIEYVIGQKALTELSSGGDSRSNLSSLLNGGGSSKNNDFGGRGGNFVYDYYGRIKYNDQLPENGKLLITYLGIMTSTTRKLSVNPDNNIIDTNYPKYEIVPDTLLDLKVKLNRGYEIDCEKSTINDISFKEFEYKMYVDGVLKDVKIELTDIDHYQIQNIRFPMLVEDTKINLITKKIKYKIFLISSEQSRYYIKNCKIIDVDLLNHNNYVEFEEGKDVELNLQYTDGNRLINEDIFNHYLCLEPDKIKYTERDRTNTHNISFNMPARNVVLRIEVDTLLFLTIEYHQRQVIEERDKEIPRPIEDVLIRNYGQKVYSLPSSPYRLQVKYGSVLDFYVKFTDIFQHLDKDLIYSQVPNADIEEAGEFSNYLFPNQILPEIIIGGN